MEPNALIFVKLTKHKLLLYIPLIFVLSFLHAEMAMKTACFSYNQLQPQQVTMLELYMVHQKVETWVENQNCNLCKYDVRSYIDFAMVEILYMRQNWQFSCVFTIYSL